MTKLEGLPGAGVDGAGVHAGENGFADDVRDQEKDDLVFLIVGGVGGEEIFEEGELAEAGRAADVEGVLLGDDAGEEAGFAVLELDGLLGGALSDDGLGDAGDGDVAGVREHFDLQLEGDFAVVVDGGGHVDVDADVEVGELGLNADAGDAGGDAGVVGAGGDGNLLTDLELGALAVGGADAGVLQDAGVGVVEQRVDRGGTMVTPKLLALRWASELRVKGLGVVVVVPVVVVLPVLVVVLGLACGVMVIDCGRVMPRLRILSRLTSRTATSTTTSGRARSRSFSSFCAKEQLVGSGAHDDGVLAGDEIDLDAGVEQVADGDDDFVGVVLLAGVGEVEGLDGLLVEIVRLCGCSARRRWCWR